MVNKMIVAVSIVGLFALASCSPMVPPYIECVDSSDCGKDECCTIGLGRFTIPQCRKMLDLDEVCRPDEDHEPFSTGVIYPDGTSINLTNVYYTVCPCMGHLTCSSTSSKSSTCVERLYFLDDNYIDEVQDYD